MMKIMNNHKMIEIDNGKNKMLTLLFKVVAMWLLDEKDDVNFNGTEEEIKTLSNVMLASKDFYVYLRSDKELDPNIMSSLLNKKNHFAKKFLNIFHINWPF